MEPNLLVGDRLFVSKFTYGYSKHSLPFSPNLSNKRFFDKKPTRGDIVVFKTPTDNRTDYIKRLIGIPGDTFQIINGEIFLNGSKILRKRVNFIDKVYCGDQIIKVNAFEEILPNGIKYVAVYNREGTMQNTNLFVVPQDHFFFMGDNRDCSKDSRYLGSVGYVNKNNLVGKAQIIFFSSDKKIGGFFKFWKWKQSIRTNRFFMKIK